MEIVFRMDASRRIGIGHVMRCLALAEELKRRGARVTFVCRNSFFDIERTIEKRGVDVKVLPAAFSESKIEHVPECDSRNQLFDVPWLQDAEETLAVIGQRKFDWLVVDHYGLDARWHRMLRNNADRLMAIDDLANRFLFCDLLLDQTYGRQAFDYRQLVPNECNILVGSEYALLRDEFARLRSDALERRKNCPVIKEVLVSVGGCDPDNITAQILEGLSLVSWQQSPCVTVVLGAGARHCDQIVKIAQRHPLDVRVNVDENNMAEVMSNADLAIGSGGTTSWERCAMGLPSLIFEEADNQRLIVRQLCETCAAILLTLGPGFPTELAMNVERLIQNMDSYMSMQRAAAGVCDGEGVHRVVDRMMLA